MENTSCSEVQAILALSLLKNEKDVTLMTFTDDKNKLKPVEWTKQTSYDKALENFAKETVRNFNRNFPYLTFYLFRRKNH